MNSAIDVKMVEIDLDAIEASTEAFRAAGSSLGG